MKAKCFCSYCYEEAELSKIKYLGFAYSDFYTNCPSCSRIITLDAKKFMKLVFITDVEKMNDFQRLTKEEFLKSYSYLTEDEYDATALYLKWLTH